MIESKSETELKRDLMIEIRTFFPRFVSLRHEDKLNFGYPDISVSGNGTTTWIEAKVIDHRLKAKSKGIQKLTMQQLASVTHAFYVVWIYTKEGGVFTYIVRPLEIGLSSREWVDFSVGIDHDFVVERLKEIHNVDNSE
jgi:hypothetical protein